MPHLFLVHFHQNDVFSYTPDALPGNPVFALMKKKATQFSRGRNNQGANATAFLVKLQIHHPSETSRRANINHIFVLQFAHKHDQITRK